MKTPIDRNDQPLSAYLLKILTVLVKRSGGEIRIDATDMIDESSEGISKRYDREKKQLVLSFIESGSEIYFNKGDEWQSQTDQLKQLNSPMVNRQGQRSSIVQPLRQSDLTDNSTSVAERMSSTLDDTRIADLEDHLRKEAAARIISNFPGTPVTEPAKEPLRVIERGRREGNRVPPSFYRS